MTLRPSKSTTIALLLSPLGLLLISATRVLIISDYNPATASTIVSSGSYIDTLLGTVIPLVSILMPYFALVLLFFNRVIVSLLAFLAAALVSPTPITLSGAAHIAYKDWRLLLDWAHKHISIVMISGIVLLLLLLAVLAGPGFYALLKTAAPIASLLLIPFIFIIYPMPLNNNSNYYSDLIRQPWLPAVRITLYSGQPVVGYILSTDDKWFTVLVANSRRVRYIHAGNVAKRRVCQTVEPKATKPLLTLITTVPTVPKCEPVRHYHSAGAHTATPSQ